MHNLNLLPAHQQPTAITAILRKNGALAADNAVQGIADEKGDKVAKTVVNKLSGLVAAEIIRDFDYSKPGIVLPLLSPAKLHEAIIRLPLVDDETKRDENSSKPVTEVICGVILQKEPHERGQYFKKLAESDVGLLAIASVFPPESFVYYHRNRSFEPDGEEITAVNAEPGNWQELIVALKKNAPSIFNRVSELIIMSIRTRKDIESLLYKTAREQFTAERFVTDDPFAS